MTLELTCPFCHEDDFDIVGLKLHLLNGNCDRWNELPKTLEEDHRYDKKHNKDVAKG